MYLHYLQGSVVYIVATERPIPIYTTGTINNIKIQSTIILDSRSYLPRSCKTKMFIIKKCSVSLIQGHINIYLRYFRKKLTWYRGQPVQQISVAAICHKNSSTLILHPFY